MLQLAAVRISSAAFQSRQRPCSCSSPPRSCSPRPRSSAWRRPAGCGSMIRGRPIAPRSAPDQRRWRSGAP